MTNILDNASFKTRCIHAGELKDDQFGAMTTPIYQTSTYRFDNTQQGINRFKGEEQGYVYTRIANPTRGVLEEKVAALEGAKGAIACGSGMGALASLIFTYLQAGDHVIIGDCLYGCSDLLIRQTMPKFQVDVTPVDTSNIEAVKAAIQPNTKMIFFETPTNPLMKVTDIAAVKEAAGDIMVVVDNTFAPPPIQRPFDFGADVIIHSATKYLNGHGDVIGGFIVANDEALLSDLRRLGMSKLTGAVMSPFDAFLITRGLQTLDLRVRQHCENAFKIAKYLQTKEEVAKVYYPALAESEDFDLVQKQMNGFGTGILSFELQKEIRGKSGFKAAETLLDSMQVVTLAVSLGDPFSLIEYPYRMTHAIVPDDVKLAGGITPELIRFSAGLEDVDDLIADFEQAFEKI